MPDFTKFKNARVSIALLFMVFILFLMGELGLLDFGPGGNGLFVSQGTNSYLLQSRLLSLDTMLFGLCGVALALLLPVITPIVAIIFISGLSVLLYLIGQLFSFFYQVIPLEYFLLMIFILYIVNILISYFINIHSQQKLIEIFGQYIPMEIVKEISQDKDAVSLEAQARELTVMFCDIQNFSSLAEELNPKQLGKLLNQYFTELSEIMFRYRGTIDKFIGDSIMVFWGAPVRQPDHAQKSVLCALEMANEIEQLSQRFIQKGWPGPRAGIGINTGLMAVGNMGSKYRMAYTVIGDSVNIAARAESLTRVYRVPIIVTEATMQKVDAVIFRELDTVTMKGKRISSKLFQPLCLKNEIDEALTVRLSKHASALKSYYEKDFDAAIKQFDELKAGNPEDTYYSVMLDKINALVQEV